MSDQPNNPLHGVTLKAIVEDLVARRGFDNLGALIKIRCFTHEPSVSSSLKFLRRNAWARGQVEALFLDDQRELDKERRAFERRRSRGARRAERKAEEER